LLLAPLAVLFATVGPIPQEPAYHALADRRAFFGVANFLNVATNAVFLLVGAVGLQLWLTTRLGRGHRSWGVFFFGVMLVALGSSCYHLDPGDATLVWDRLPMTVAFMALFSAMLAEKVAPEFEGKILPVALIVGMSSVLWWRYSNDLRLYAWVQFGPLLALVYMLIAYPARPGERRYLACGLAFYVIAKICESADNPIFAATSGAISGHSLKHLFAAVATFCVYLLLRTRERANG
jgi:hypothetical protein